MVDDIIPKERIQQIIYLIRGQKVILDRDLARLYEIDTKVLKQAVRRNLKRFPEDFMFVLTKEEFNNWRSQIVTSNSDRMGWRYPPMAFTEQGVAMLSSVLHSERAIKVNIEIMCGENDRTKPYPGNHGIQYEAKTERLPGGSRRAGILEIRDAKPKAPPPASDRLPPPRLPRRTEASPPFPPRFCSVPTALPTAQDRNNPRLRALTLFRLSTSSCARSGGPGLAPRGRLRRPTLASSRPAVAFRNF